MCASSRVKAHGKRCVLKGDQRPKWWLIVLRQASRLRLRFRVDRMSHTPAVEEEETAISSTDSGGSVVAVMQPRPDVAERESDLCLRKGPEKSPSRCALIAHGLVILRGCCASIQTVGQ